MPLFQNIGKISLALLLILITGALGSVHLLDVNLGLLVVILEADACDIIIVVVNDFPSSLFE